jgi:dTDP-4-amino-4,6-dideoxygalactose transaminase
VGGLSKLAAFSFYPTKNLGAYGEGGALTTNDDRVAEYARAARSHGQSGRYQHEFVGYNYRMDGIQGAILRVKLKRLPEWTAQRQAFAAEYKRLLAGARIQLLRDDPADECAYHLFTVYVGQRDAVRKQMEAAGIETVVHYPTPLHLQPAYAALGYPRGTLPYSERACETAISLPLFPGMTVEQVRYVAEKLREVTASLHAVAAQ